MVESKQSFNEVLERRAQRVVAQARENSETSPVVGGMVREIELVLDQIDAWHAIRERLLNSLLRGDCYADTELMQMEARTPRYSPHRFPEREKCQRRLVEIDKERRRLETQHERTVVELENRLFTLLEQHAQLSGV